MLCSRSSQRSEVADADEAQDNDSSNDGKAQSSAACVDANESGKTALLTLRQLLNSINRHTTRIRLLNASTLIQWLRVLRLLAPTRFPLSGPVKPSPNKHQSCKLAYRRLSSTIFKPVLEVLFLVHRERHRLVTVNVLQDKVNPVLLVLCTLTPAAAGLLANPWHLVGTRHSSEVTMVTHYPWVLRLCPMHGSRDFHGMGLHHFNRRASDKVLALLLGNHNFESRSCQ